MKGIISVAKKKNETFLQGLKRFMLLNKLSTVDLNWDMFKKYNISMPKLLKWELKQKKLN